MESKIRTGPPIDAERDHETDIWAGVISVHTAMKDIERCPRLEKTIDTPNHVADFVNRRVLFRSS